MNVLAVDPGKTTGWAFHHGADGSVSWGQDEPMAFLDTVATWLPLLDAVVCEAYLIGPETLRKTRQHWSLEQIGALRWLAHRRGCPFTLQTAADAKAFMTDDKLRALGWWATGEQHARDALRHLGLYLVRAELLDPRRLLDG